MPPRPLSLSHCLPGSRGPTALRRSPSLRRCLRTPPPSSHSYSLTTPLLKWEARSFTTTIPYASRSKTYHTQDNYQPVTQEFEKRQSARSATAKSSLRRAAGAPPVPDHEPKICTAYCTAEKYNLPLAAEILRDNGYTIDPFLTGLADQVLHLHLLVPRNFNGIDTQEARDVFIFPTGNIVAWSIPSAQISTLASLLSPAAEAPYTKEVETESLEFIEDSRIRKSRIAGDVIILGTAPFDQHTVTGSPVFESVLEKKELATQTNVEDANVTLAKVAFSSGLSRSTKLAVLESLLNNYLETTSTIPTMLSNGSRLPFTRSFILRKTGELLEFRAQLNLYSELTDSLPDIFWDSRHELGLEGYYESVGRALDVNVRIRQLNEKLDYASGIVEVLRERLSETHSLRLEWIIIILIAVEVVFEVMRLWKEGSVDEKEERKYRRWKEKKERESDAEYQEWLREN